MPKPAHDHPHPRTLILVDIQNDFLPEGALAVPGGNEIIQVANRLQNRFDLLVATQDWHPANHSSFARNPPHRKPGDIVQLGKVEQTLWPAHCVQGTLGAAFPPRLIQNRLDRIVKKGTSTEVDSYSAFFDNARLKATGLLEYLKEKRVVEVYICGLATDYCVKHTALDALSLGFKTWVVEDACRGVNLQPYDAPHALQAMNKAGIKIVSSRHLPF